MTNCSLADLQKTLTPHVHLGKTRLETLCLLVLGMISARTVNLTHIAAERPARAKVASTYRRLQRFFQQVRLPDDWSVGIVIALIGNPDRWYLCIDRTNWKIGKSDVNILMLAVVTERYRVPLMWTFLSHSGKAKGHSASPRTALDLLERIQQHVARIGPATKTTLTRQQPEQLDLFEALSLKTPA